MQYTCGYWGKADNLIDAQILKMELIAKKLDLNPGMTVLDIGCGWGTLCKYLAQNYGVQCVGVTISKTGLKYGQRVCQGLPVEFRLQDYRDIKGKFDRVITVGMFEHVGHHNGRTFVETAHWCLKDCGIFLFHAIGNNHPYMPGSESWMNKYIFPNCELIYFRDLINVSECLFIIEDWHNFGPDYAKTIEAWIANFNRNWPSISHKYGDKMYRRWVYFLSMIGGTFKARRMQLWQVVFSKDGPKNGYRSVR